MNLNYKEFINILYKQEIVKYIQRKDSLKLITEAWEEAAGNVCI